MGAGAAGAGAPAASAAAAAAAAAAASGGDAAPPDAERLAAKAAKLHEAAYRRALEPPAPRGRPLGPADISKSRAANTGFCGMCDTYLLRLLADEFGYKVANRVLAAATVGPNVDDDLERHGARARLEGQPLMRTDPEAYAAAEAAQAAAVAAAAAAGVPVDFSSLPRLPQRRKDWSYPDDAWLELWEDESKRFFYYNVATGASTWFAPPVYAPYQDDEAKVEEAIVKSTALQALAKASSSAAPSRRLG